MKKFRIQIVETTDYVVEAESESEAYDFVHNCGMGERRTQTTSTSGIWEMSEDGQWIKYPGVTN